MWLRLTDKKRKARVSSQCKEVLTLRKDRKKEGIKSSSLSNTETELHSSFTRLL